jgi:nitrate/TMAO reductase-like tetraheme cytochrome c subunit
MADTPPKRSKRRRRLVRGAVVVGVLFIIVSVAGVEMTSKSSFCNTCHIMGTYYDSWVADTHSNIPCVSCHIEPGAKNFISAKLNGLGQVVDDTLNRTSTKPSASVSQFACLREGCHLVENLGAGRADLPFLFDHQKHLGKEHRGIVIECTSCHSHIRGDKHFEVNTNACITCHLYDAPASAPGQTIAFGPHEIGIAAAAGGVGTGAHVDVAHAPSDCQSCHEPPSEPIEYQGLIVDHGEFVDFGASCESCHRNVTGPGRAVEDTHCITCHNFGLERAGDVEELHRIHTEGRHKVECFNCHGKTPHGPGAALMTLNKFDCQSCHQDQHALQRSVYLTESEQQEERALVNPMFMAHVDCAGCHVQPREVTGRAGTGAMVATATAEACDACHKPGLGDMMIGLWQRTTRELYDEAIDLLPVPDRDWTGGDPEAAEAVRRAEQLLEQVRLDGSWGVHNPEYTQKLIEQARELLVDAGALGGGGEDAP